MRVVRGLSGMVAGGILVLAATVATTAIIGARRGFPGPGWTAVTWHVAAAAGVLAAQIYADRHRGFAAFFGCSVVFSVAGYLLWVQWWN